MPSLSRRIDQSTPCSASTECGGIFGSMYNDDYGVESESFRNFCANSSSSSSFSFISRMRGLYGSRFLSFVRTSKASSFAHVSIRLTARTVRISAFLGCMRRNMRACSTACSCRPSSCAMFASISAASTWESESSRSFL